IATSAAARAYSVSPWLLQLRFGRARASRSFDELREAYQARLARGGGASGRFVPERDDPPAADPIVRRTMLLSRSHRVNERFRSGIRTWRATARNPTTDPRRLPGRLTIRELAVFTMSHARHHIGAAPRRLPRFNPVLQR